MRIQISLLQNINENTTARNKIESFIEENYSNFPTFTSQGDLFAHCENILVNLCSLALGLDKHQGVAREATLLYFSLDRKLFTKIPEEVSSAFLKNFIFKESMFNQTGDFFEFNGHYWSKIFSENHKKLIKFFDINIELLPKSAKSYFSVKNLDRQNINNFKPISSIKNDFEYKLFLNSLPEVLNIDLLTKILRVHNSLNLSNNAEPRTYIHFLKAIEEKYPNHNEFGLMVRFKKELFSKLIQSIEEYIVDFEDKDGFISFLKRHENISKMILLELNPNELFKNIIPIFLDVLKDEPSVKIIDRFFANRLLIESKNSFYFRFNDLNDEDRKKLVIEAKKQFLNRFPSLCC